MAESMDTDRAIRERWRQFGAKRDECGRRLFSGMEARACHRRGVSRVARITGLARSTIYRGQADLDKDPLPEGQIRRKGGGRRRFEEKHPEVMDALKSIVEPVTSGHPIKPLQWVSKSLAKIARAIKEMVDLSISPKTVARLLRKLKFSRQVNRKSIEGKRHPDRDQQFHYIASQLRKAEELGQPAISVDSKKKELVGPFRNGGSDYRPEGDPIRVNTHDFPTKAGGKVTPYVVFCMVLNMAWVSVGISCDTSKFAVNTIRRWFREICRVHYPECTDLWITADSGGSNGARVRLWKLELQKLADEFGIRIHVHHYPPGASKYNKVEHRCNCHISANWRGTPLTDHETILRRIAATTTEAGLKVKCALDRRSYKKGIKVTDEEMNSLNIEGHSFHPDWNYSISPRL